MPALHHGKSRFPGRLNLRRLEAGLRENPRLDALVPQAQQIQRAQKDSDGLLFVTTLSADYAGLTERVRARLDAIPRNPGRRFEEIIVDGLKLKQFILPIPAHESAFLLRRFIVETQPNGIGWPKTVGREIACSGSPLYCRTRPRRKASVRSR